MEGVGGRAPPEGDINPPSEQTEPEGVHPLTLEQKNPPFVQGIYDLILSIPSYYAWTIFIIGFIIFLNWHKICEMYENWMKMNREKKEVAFYKKNPDLFIEREKKVEQSRLALQEKYNNAALEHAKKKAEREEQKRLEKITEWENLEQGKGYYNKSKGACKDSSNSEEVCTRKPSGKPKLRPEYNPLMGAGGGASGWRRSAPRRSGGG